MAVLIASQAAATVRVVDEHLLFTDARVGGVMNDGTDQGAALASFITLVQDGNGHNNRGVIPNGQLECGRKLTIPRGVTIEGQGEGNDETVAPTSIRWRTDLGAGSAAIELPSTSRITLRKLLLLGPGMTRSVAAVRGELPAQMEGVIVRSGHRVEKVQVRGFASGLAMYDDHHYIADCDLRGNGYGLHYPSNPTGGAGDSQFHRLYLTDQTRASVAVADTSIMSSVVFEQSHMGAAAFAFWRYRTTDTPRRPTSFSHVHLRACGLEVLSHAMIMDERLDSELGNFSFDGCAATSAFLGAQWMQTVAAAGSNGSATLTGVALTVYEPRIGMAVSGTNIPAGTLVTGVSGTPGNYTVTMSASATGTVTSANIGMRQDLAEINAGTISGMHFAHVSPAGTAFTATPNLWDNHAMFSADSIQAVRIDFPEILVGGMATGTITPPFDVRTPGDNDRLLGIDLGFGSRESGNMRATARLAGAAITKWDLLELYNYSQVRPWQGGLPIGYALHDTASGKAVHILTSGYSSTLQGSNKTGSVLANNALLKPDPVNAGGVIAASSITDGPIVGRVRASSGIAASSTGAIRVWMP